MLKLKQPNTKTRQGRYEVMEMIISNKPAKVSLSKNNYLKGSSHDAHPQTRFEICI